jgi:hypothetical protein
MGTFQCFCLQGLDVKVVATRALLAGVCFHAYQQVGRSNELDSKFWDDYFAVNHTKYYLVRLTVRSHMFLNLFTINVLFYQVKMFYSVQTTNSTMVGKK